MAFLAASIAEQEQMAQEAAKRDSVRRAMTRAATGDELLFADLDLTRPEVRRLFIEAQEDIRGERERQERAAAAMLALERLRGKAPL